MKSPEELDGFQRPIASLIRFAVHFVDPEAEVILYGSQARGEADKWSDWDVVVIRGDEITRQYRTKIHDAIYLVELATEEVITPTVVERNQWEKDPGHPFYLNVMKDGVSLNDPSFASF